MKDRFRSFTVKFRVVEYANNTFILRDIIKKEKLQIDCNLGVINYFANYALHGDFSDELRGLGGCGTVVQLLEIHEDQLVCETCGSVDTMITAWIDPNTNELVQDACDAEAWCLDCEDSVALDWASGVVQIFPDSF